MPPKQGTPDHTLELIGLRTGQVRAVCRAGDFATTISPYKAVDDFLRLQYMHSIAYDGPNSVEAIAGRTEPRPPSELSHKIPVSPGFRDVHSPGPLDSGYPPRVGGGSAGDRTWRRGQTRCRILPPPRARES